MADVLTGVTETVASAVDVVSAQAQMFLEQESKMIPLVQNFSSLVVKGAKSIDIPRAGGFTVNDKAENTAEDAQSITFAADSLLLDKHKVVQWLVEDIANEQSVLAVSQEALLRAAKNMARKVDQDIIDELETISSAAAPDHRIGYANNPTDTIQETDILAARQLLIEQFLSPDELWMGVAPSQEAEMLKLSNFIDASKYGAGTPLASGEIGKVFGVRVVVHNDVENLKTLMWHPTACAYASQFGPRFQQDLDLPNLAMRGSLDSLYGVKGLDSGKRVVMIGTAA